MSARVLCLLSAWCMSVVVESTDATRGGAVPRSYHTRTALSVDTLMLTGCLPCRGRFPGSPFEALCLQLQRISLRTFGKCAARLLQRRRTWRSSGGVE